MHVRCRLMLLEKWLCILKAQEIIKILQNTYFMQQSPS
jgi:hypothetical protein